MTLLIKEKKMSTEIEISDYSVMSKILLKGQFCVGNVKSGKFGEIEFVYDGKNFHIPAMLDVGNIPYTFVKDLDQQFGSSDWDCWEVIAEQQPNGEWRYTGDYGRSDYIGQYNRDEW